jgi:hypothetical protein
MLLSFEILDGSWGLCDSPVAAFFYDDSVTLCCMHLQAIELTRLHWQWLQDRNVEHFWVTTHYRISRIPSPLPIGGVLGELVEAGPVSRHKMQLLLSLRERHAVG